MLRPHVLITLLAVMTLAGAALCQPGVVCIFYVGDINTPALGCPCVNGQPYADGTPVQLLEDVGGDGPDSMDVEVATWPINGESEGLGQGYFYTDVCVEVHRLDVSYYVQVNSGDCCWQTRDFTFQTGPQDLDIQGTDWTCHDNPCPPNGWQLQVCTPENSLTLMCPCTRGTALPAGTAMDAYLDANDNGPDITDPLIGTFPMSAPGILCCFFGTRLEGPVHFYVQAGDLCCWTTPVITESRDNNWTMLSPTDWTCSAQTCRTPADPPVAPANFRASDDSLCQRVAFFWDHDGTNVSGFQICRTSDSVSITRVQADARSMVLQVGDAATRDYFIRATGPGGSSGPSNVDAGSPHLVRFAEDSTGDIRGFRSGGEAFTLAFAHPVPPANECEIVDSLFLLTENGQEELLASGQNVQQLTGHFPNWERHQCRVILISSYATEGRGFVSTDTTESTFELIFMGTQDHPAPLPLKTELVGAYPNPFNPATRIQFTLAVPQNVRVVIYNLQGQMVRTLTSGTLPAGTHSVVWDGTSDANLPVGTGLYLCRMSAGQTVSTQRVMLLK